MHYNGRPAPSTTTSVINIKSNYHLSDNVNKNWACRSLIKEEAGRAVVLEINIALDCAGVRIILYIQYRSGIVLFKYAVKNLQPSETEFQHSLQKYNTHIQERLTHTNMLKTTSGRGSG